LARLSRDGAAHGVGSTLPGLGRAALIASALRLSYFTIAWNGVIGVAALILAAMTGSPALAGLALNALLDSSASVVLVWRFRRERRDPAGAERLEASTQVDHGRDAGRRGLRRF
jgi:membrane protein implicated in regulation of membrane protease activity